MDPLTHLFLFSILLFSSIFPSYNSLNEEPVRSYFDESSGYDNRAYPTYLDGIYGQDGGRDHHHEELMFSNSVGNIGPPNIDEDEFDEDLELSNILDTSTEVVNLDDFGAKADGLNDDTKAFRKAWKRACSRGAAVLLVPKNKKYLLKPLILSGPCNSNLTLRVDGTIEASTHRSHYIRDTRHWLAFQFITNFMVKGGGTINGNGEIWWRNSCKIDKSRPCVQAPTALTFYKCNNLRIRNINIKNAQQMHLSFQNCINVQARDLRVTAPEKSPNTDGIHVTASQNIRILNSVIGTGDDCISIVSGSKKIRAWNITCGPGHGISIGSLGAGKSEAHVSDVIVDGARFMGTTNGVRIKTWQGGFGSANNIIFRNIAMKNVENPIIVDQKYCDQAKPCKEEDAAVQVSDVVYKNIIGTSESEVAINFDCSKNHPCRNIVLQDVNLVRETREAASATCKNVKWTKMGKVSPICA